MVVPLILSTILGAPNSVSGIVTDGRRPLADAVVWLEGEEHGKPVHADVVQKGKRFVPRILVVPKGSRVGFPNRDDIFHNVFAEYNAKKFDLGMYPKGQTREVTFDKPGLVAVLCNVHSEMSAFIMVVDSAHFAKTDKNGHFELAHLEGSEYTLRAWHESGKTYKKPIHAPATNLSLRLAR